MTKIFLVVIAVWEMAYRHDQATPMLVQEMPSLAACEAVGTAIVRMTKEERPARYECVTVADK